MLNPSYPSPVVAGNVETSQHLIDILNVALKVQSACYGTMSNITFGDKNFGYYETICGEKEHLLVIMELMLYIVI